MFKHLSKRNFVLLSLTLLALVFFGIWNNANASATNAVVYRFNKVSENDISIKNPANINWNPMADISYKWSTEAIDVKTQLFLLKFEDKENFTKNINQSFTDLPWSYTRQVYQSELRNWKLKLDDNRDWINYYAVCYTKIYSLGANQNAKVYVCPEPLQVSIYSGTVYTWEWLTKFLEEKAKQDEATETKYAKWFRDMFDAWKKNPWTRWNWLMTWSNELDAYIEHLYFNSWYNADQITDVIYNFDFNSKITKEDEFKRYITFYCSVLWRQKEEKIRKQEAEQQQAQDEALNNKKSQLNNNSKLANEYSNLLTQQKNGEDYANKAIDKLNSYWDKITFVQAIWSLQKTISNLEANRTNWNSISTDRAIILLKLEMLRRYQKQYSL